MVSTPFAFADYQDMADFILKLSPVKPEIAIICGSGLGTIADRIEEAVTIPYEDIPNFPRSTVPGHAGCLVIGKLNGIPVVAMKGRLHLYEGHPVWKTTSPVRVFKLMGIDKLIVSNAAGSVNPDFKVGDVMLIKDYLNMPGVAGINPLQGPNIEEFGPRFPPMSAAFDRQALAMAKETAEEMAVGKRLKEGVYMMLGGPSYETIAEYRMARTVGADVVGMSTVPEVIVAAHAGMKVFGFTLVTNAAVMDYSVTEFANHEEVLEAGREAAKDLCDFVEVFVTKYVC
ncbi:MAG: uncharacterized protein KVP18_000420 [Porospora cf. gigantea A]|uniref:uncharacterized protein n=1 Tax=Porospora cf. gigantea A TaxID=2853593 RepID=UPI0035593E31|nr:MAG: hypothetical protein KVP18_000420 [Porospora cf. gigantea A]